MSETPSQSRWSLPYETTTPTDPSSRRWVRAAQVAIAIAVGAMLLAPAVQVEYRLLRNQRRAAAYAAAEKAGTLTAKQIAKGPPKPHQGAITRWFSAIRAMWDGYNIYESPEQVIDRRERTGEVVWDDRAPRLMHPNMPGVVVLLTPLAYLPIGAGLAVFSLLKVLAVVAAMLATVRVCNHADWRMPDWVVALGVGWWALLIVSDLQHANTNGFVLAAIVLHLWLYRRGHDGWAGAALAGAIALKLTPLLFVVYWLYQRNWRLLGGCVLGGLGVGVVLPALTIGPARFIELTATWLDNIILSGLAGRWYPIHVNQSLPAILSRYFLGGQPGGDIYWNLDDMPYEFVSRHRWIALTSLSPATVRWIIRAVQLLIVGVMAWAVGWRKLDRRDGRRGLHWAMVLAAILLLNQRTWDHHAAILLPAYLAVWYAIAFGRFPHRRLRGVLVAGMMACGLLLWLTAEDLMVGVARIAMDKPEAEQFAETVNAIGLRGWSWAILFACAATLAGLMRRRQPPYSTQRQTDFTKSEYESDSKQVD